jgi:hypothetical protein
MGKGSVDEQKFVDLARSPVWITEEHVVVEDHGP